MDAGLDADDTASWGMRADYNLPSAYGLAVVQGQVFWPMHTDDLFYLVENDASTDHRLVWQDLAWDTDAEDTDGGGSGGDCFIATAVADPADGFWSKTFRSLCDAWNGLWR